MSNRRTAGGWRNKLGGTALSRLRFECQVPTCKASSRSDTLKTHYINCVQFDAKGLPIDLESVEFERLNEKKKITQGSLQKTVIVYRSFQVMARLLLGRILFVDTLLVLVRQGIQRVKIVVRGQVKRECKLLITIEELQAKFYQPFSRLSVFGAIDVNLRYVAN